MISKKLLLASVCLAVLIVAVGAYDYALYSQVSSLESQLEDLQREISLLSHGMGFTNTSKTFNFFWGGPIAEKFNVTTFWMNITFQRENETTLLITVKINHLRYDTHSYDYIGIAFDTNHDGELGVQDGGSKYLRLKYYVDPYFAKQTAGFVRDVPSLGNTLYHNGQLFFNCIAMCYSRSNHTVYFDPELGYTYIILINLQRQGLTNDLIHIEYDFTVSLEFCFGMELIA